MKWTKTPPTEPGWYWFRSYSGDDMEAVEVSDGKAMSYTFGMRTIAAVCKTYPACQWSDAPLPEPTP